MSYLTASLHKRLYCFNIHSYVMLRVFQASRFAGRYYNALFTIIFYIPGFLPGDILGKPPFNFSCKSLLILIVIIVAAVIRNTTKTLETNKLYFFESCIASIVKYIMNNANIMKYIFYLSLSLNAC